MTDLMGTGMARRTVLKFAAGVGAAVALPAVASCSSGAPSASATTAAAGTGTSSAFDGSLVFDPSAYTEKSETITTGAGDRSVTYRAYSNIPYCSKPVDTTYQCLTVKVPTSIDGKAVDASRAPIVLANSIGGYMSSTPDGGGMAMGPMSGAPTGAPGGSGAPSGVQSGSGEQVGANGQHVDNGQIALAYGYVVVVPGARGRDNVKDGRYYGKAPAGIVDLKAAVRYLKLNAGTVPGNTEWIVSSGSSAGGAYSALLGASGDSELYDSYLREIGAADTSDAIFASADYCPITDLEHADAAYEWMFGSAKLASGTVDATISTELSAMFPAYQASLRLSPQGFGPLTSDTYDDYLLKTYLQPAATDYLKGLSESDRSTYLKSRTWITWAQGKASFTWADHLTYVGRSKAAPAFDDLEMKNAEPIEFGDATTNARHFTEFSLRKQTGDASAQLAADMPQLRTLMNPMYFLGRGHAGRSKHWFIRVGTSDTDTSLSVVGNLAATAQALGDDVDAAMYWDAGHGTNNDADAFMAWIATITGYTSNVVG